MRAYGLIAAGVLLGAAPGGGGWAAAGVPQAAATAAETPEMAATRVKMMALRDQFVAEVKAHGFTCSLPVPKILVEDVPSMGQYDDETNTLRTTDWTLLNPQEKSFMRHLAGPDAQEPEMRVVFEKAAHQWIFVHEVGHWWQACRGVKATGTPPWQVESGANRIALAYWRERDPSVETLMARLFHQVLDTMPSPVPAGQTVEVFFNTNYATLGPSPTYPWFQSRMNVTLEEERPKPSFKQALAETLP